MLLKSLFLMWGDIHIAGRSIGRDAKLPLKLPPTERRYRPRTASAIAASRGGTSVIRPRPKLRDLRGPTDGGLQMQVTLRRNCERCPLDEAAGLRSGLIWAVHDPMPTWSPRKPTAMTTVRTLSRACTQTSLLLGIPAGLNRRL